MSDGEALGTTGSTDRRTGGTTAVDYSEAYYRHYSDTDEPYDWSSAGWRAFFSSVARRLVEAAGGQVESVLDVGCAKGMLVHGFLAAGVPAPRGFDISAAAVGSADDEVRDLVSVGSATDPIEGRYDLVTCVEVVEHMSAADALTALDRMCEVTDRIVLSSTPGDFDEPTHVNVRPTADWAAELAARGFFRRTDIDLSFLSPWAGFYERAALSPRDVVHRYESFQYPLRQEVLVKRTALLDTQRALDEARSEPVRSQSLEHDLLTTRDALVGAEASAATARARVAQVEADNARLAGENHALAERLQEYARSLEGVLGSRRWRALGVASTPVETVRRVVRGRA